MKKIKKERNKIYNAIVAILLLINILVVFEIVWLEKNVGPVSLDEILFHIRVPKEGTSMDLIKDNIIYCFIPTILLTAGLLFFLFKSYKYNFSLIINIKNKEIHILTHYAFLVCLIIVNIVFIIWRIEYINGMFKIKEYISLQSQKSTLIEENYVDSKNVSIDFPEQKKNLIYIYVESLEANYNSVNFDDKENYNIIPKLEELANDNINFSGTETLGGAYQLFGTSWTASGMIANTAGIPLLSPVDMNEYVGYDSYMPNLTNLGDILNKEGYTQILMMGSDSTFAGKNTYYKTHGNYIIKDLNTAKEDKIIKKNYYVNWGFEDSILFKYAKDEIIKLSKEDNPFNFTLLTSNTHFPDGYTEKDCEKISENNLYVNSIYCSQGQIYDFVSWVKEQDFYENTTIIIVGDHLTMAANEIVKEPYEQRRIFNVIINSSVSSNNTKNREFSSLDMFPTTLASLGATIENNKLGLGVNLFSDEETLVEKNGFEYVNLEFNKKSDYYNKFFYNN